MSQTSNLIESFNFNKLRNQKADYFRKYEPLLGYRTTEFFNIYCEGVNVQKQLILELQSEEITNKILKEKFGDNFAAKVAGAGDKAMGGLMSLYTGAGFGGRLGAAAGKKIGAGDDGTKGYLSARNNNFTRSLGDYLSQLKTFDNTVPDKVGLVTVKSSGVLAGLWQKGKQIVGGSTMVLLAGTNIPVAALTGTAFAAVNGVDLLQKKLNELFDVQWKKIQNTQPVKDFDRVYEVKKEELRKKLSALDADGKETSKILKMADDAAEYVKKNPTKSGVFIALITATLAVSAGPLGLGVMTAAQIPILTATCAFFMRTGLGLLKGETASTAIGGALKAAVIGFITGKVISAVSDTILQAIKIGVPPPTISAETLARVDVSDMNIVKYRFTTNYGLTDQPLNNSAFSRFYDAMGGKLLLRSEPTFLLTNVQETTFEALRTTYNDTNSEESTLALFSYLKQVIEGNHSRLQKAIDVFNNALRAGRSAQAAAIEFNAAAAEIVNAATVAGAAGAGAAIGAAGAASGSPPKATVAPVAGATGVDPNSKVTESLKLSYILRGVLTEALTEPQQAAVNNLKGKLSKEITTYIKDVAKTFKVKGNSTTELLDGLRKEPKAKSAVDIIDSLLVDFPKLKLEFPKDVKVNDKELDIPPTPVGADDGTKSTPPPPPPGDGGAGAGGGDGWRRWIPPAPSGGDKKPDVVGGKQSSSTVATPTVESKYDDFIKKIVSENVPMTVQGLTITNTSGTTDDKMKPKNPNNTIYFRVDPGSKSLLYFVRVAELDGGTSISHGGADQSLGNFRKALASNYKLLGEAKIPITSPGEISQALIGAIAAHYASKFTQTAGDNTYNPDKKTMPELLKDYITVLTPKLKGAADAVSKSWMDALDASVAHYTMLANQYPSIEGKLFGVAFSTKGASYWFGATKEGRIAAGLDQASTDDVNPSDKKKSVKSDPKVAPKTDVDSSDKQRKTLTPKTVIKSKDKKVLAGVTNESVRYREFFTDLHR